MRESNGDVMICLVHKKIQKIKGCHFVVTNDYLKKANSCFRFRFMCFNWIMHLYRQSRSRDPIQPSRWQVLCRPLGRHWRDSRDEWCWAWNMATIFLYCWMVWCGFHLFCFNHGFIVGSDTRPIQNNTITFLKKW